MSRIKEVCLKHLRKTRSGLERERPGLPGVRENAERFAGEMLFAPTRSMQAGRPALSPVDFRRSNKIKSAKNLYSSVFFCGFIFLLSVCAIFYFGDFKTSAEDDRSEIENALFIRQEFFGAEAIVPLPTKAARENLAKLDANSPDQPEILLKLSELNERLENYGEAEANLKRSAEIDASKLETLAAFYGRRAEFEKEAAALRKILFAADAAKRAAIFERLLQAARRHDLSEYLTPEFYAQVVEENPESVGIFQRLITKLREEENYAEALKFVRQARAQFPERSSEWLAAEIEILLETEQEREAETIYRAAFDPFWSNAEAEKFYEFLSDQDRLRAYGAEVKARFQKNPADYDAAIRLALDRKNDYQYGNDEIVPIFLKLEAAKKTWSADELVTVTRLLLRENEADLASRFLYTLYAREDFQANGELRAKILYQLFQMFSAAENRKLPLTKGDLRFYEDVARADRKPGIATGILSLLFSDTQPRAELGAQENEASRFFNRAAAYRIFEAYKTESASPPAPELAQMYLDIVRLYTATEEPEVAEKTLHEFAEKFGGAGDYPPVALKLADAFAAANQPEKEREVYQKILDHLGKTEEPKRGRKSFPDADFSDDSSAVSAEKNYTERTRGSGGFDFNNQYAAPKNYYGQPANNFRDYLGQKIAPITYEEVLEKYVASFAEEKNTAEILALYSNEMAKYPNEEWLYEERLTWLGQTNLAEEELKVYRAALARFESRGWQDKLARWFLRRNRRDDFAEFSNDLIGKLNDTETQNYLSQFVDGKASSGEFEKQLYLQLYRRAHERFPHNIRFVKGLLNFYRTNKLPNEWRKLAAKYYFGSKEIREMFLDDLAERGELRNHLASARNKENIIYELFRADAAARLSDYENAVAAYRKLNEIYPHTPEFSERLVAFTRSFGQKNRASLTEAAGVAKSQADYAPSSGEQRMKSGEIFAELGDYERAGAEWEKLIATARGDKEIYLDAATVYWDYYQYADALRAIKNLREKSADDSLYAFEAGAILEAQHERARAAQEYVKALGASGDDEGATPKQKATKRLAFLAASENEMTRTIASAFERENSGGKNSPFLSLGYAEFLVEIGQAERAERVLNRAVADSRDEEFLEAARDFYASQEIATGEQFALRRLAATTDNSRRRIGYRLQLVESFAENKQRDSAKNALGELAREFPNNYGVLTETADFYWRLGYEAEAVASLRDALPRSRGAYRKALARKLSARLIQTNRLNSAEQILLNLHEQDRADAEIFRELASVLVRTGKPELMREAFDETVVALKQTDVRDRRELDDRLAGLRESMIDAFTRLKDYRSAIGQHIEIINREPENEELTTNAIRYAKRYDAAQILLDYYLKLSKEAFKNYRWNVVLARIYEANNDAENAAVNYRAAIVNQPEMIELYLALADLETRRNNFDEALKNLDAILQLTNNEASYVKKKIEVLKRAGRAAEAQAEQAKLPAEKESERATDEFSEARAQAEPEKARELYRAAFAKLLEKPLSGELKAADIAAYAQSVRADESLGAINERLWTLREKLLAIAGKADSLEAGEAKRRVSILESAMTETVGGIARTIGTDEELAALHADWQRRIEKTPLASDQHRTVSFIQDLSRRAGFGDLEETILLKKTETARPLIDGQTNLRNLINFYNERGAYQKTFDALERFGSGDLPLKAETARFVGNREKELEALRMIYQRPEEISAATDANVARYLEILHAESRAELQSLTTKSSAFQLQLVNFLLGKGERELAHAAIENADLSKAWKVSRHAETSLALKEFDETAECFFCEALRFDSIGNLIRQTPDKKSFLVNDDWFRLAREYGGWLAEKSKSQTDADSHASSESQKYLTAMVENQPRNADEQFKLGEFYLSRNAPEAAAEHFRLAIETQNYAVDDKLTLAHLGAAYHLAGDEKRAAESWKTVLENEDLESGTIYFRTLQKYDLAEKARNDLPPLIIKFLENNDADQSEAFQNLIRGVAASFAGEAEKSAYFLNILDRRPTDKSLAEMLLSENLIAKNRQGAFYESLIERSDELENYDYDYNFTAVLQRVWADADAEMIYEREKKYKTTEPENERVEYQKKYLALLVENRENERAKQLVAEIEKQLRGRYARPAWLRIARINLQIRAGKFDARAAEKFVGIAADDSTAEASLPNVERFNDVLRILKAENRAAEAAQFSESFFAQNLALGHFNQTNFAGLAGVYFQTGETEKALRVLRLLIDANDAAKRETALAEISALAPVAVKGAGFSLGEPPAAAGGSDSFAALRLAAEIAQEFGQTETAIAARRHLPEANPVDSNNRLELAKLLVVKDEQPNAVNLLTQIINDRSSLRSARLRARLILFEMGEDVKIGDAKFDALAQFGNGLFAARNGQNESATEFFVGSLIADKDAEISARQELMKLYAAAGQFYAALKLADADRAAKPDELLETLSGAAERVGDFRLAIGYEKAKRATSAEEIGRLQQLADEKNHRATDFTIDLENTKKL